MIRRFIAGVLLLIVLSMSVAGQETDRLNVVASFSIIADVVQNVGGDAVEVTSLMPIGTDPHSFQPNPRDLVALADAAVVFVAGAGFEEGVTEAIENAAENVNVVELSVCVEILAFGGHEHHDDDHHDDEHHDDEHHDDEHHDDEHENEMPSTIASLCAAHLAEFAELEGHHHDNEHHDDEHHDDEHHDDEHHAHGQADVLGRLYTLDCGYGADDHDDHDHAEGDCDPHVWSDPHNVMLWVLVIRDTLSELDPANADLYAANAAEYLEALDELLHDFVSSVVASVPEDQRVLVTNHETLGYFAHRYGFEVVATVLPGVNTLAEPSAAEVAALIDLIREEGVTAIFAENTAGTALAQQIASETGAQFFELYTDSLGFEDSPASTYIDYIRYNVTIIVNALGGSA